MNDIQTPKVIAEIGCNHKGNMDVAKELIKIPSACNRFQGIKLQIDSDTGY